VFETAFGIIYQSLALVFHHFTSKLFLAICRIEIAYSNWREIDFLVFCEQI